MQSRTAKQLLSRFLEFTESEVLGAFASLARAQKGKDAEWIYIPGTRKDRVLLVAHADTVNDHKYTPKIRWMSDVAMLESFWRKPNDKRVYDSSAHHMGGYQNTGWGSLNSLGGDDRCGCAMLWALQNLGHSLLITTGEESGLKGAKAALKVLHNELAAHVYALEVDRRGDRQAVFYDVSTEEFEEYMLNLLSKNDPEGVEWIQELGSSTDIRAICPEVRICGVNVSAGYINEHSSQEAVFVDAWLHTHGTLAKALVGKQELFVLPKKAVIHKPQPEFHEHWKWCYIHGTWSDKCPPSINENCEHVKRQAAVRANPTKGGATSESPFKLQVFRTGGSKPGEGQVELVAVGVAGKQGTLSRISKRQCKKFGKYLQGLMAKGAISRDEGTKLLQQAIELRDGLRAIVTAAQRAEHAAGGTDAFVQGMLASGKKDSSLGAEKRYPPGGQFVPYQHREGGRCWHHCNGCKKLWYHDRLEAAYCRPAYFCLCPVCSPDVVPRLIAPVESWNAAVWGYEHPANGEAPKPPAGTSIRVPVVAGPSERRTEDRQSLNEPTVCQHYCARCSNPWRHMRPPITRDGMICAVGAYDHDCPLHSALAAKMVMIYEDKLKIKTGGWTQTLHQPPHELCEKPATGNGSHGAAPQEGKDQLPLGGLGTTQMEVSGGGGVSN